MKTVTVQPDLIAFLQMHDTALALGLIFAFVGAAFLSPVVTK